ncbi:unnamed protein product, partial [Staurois parvus]
VSLGHSGSPINGKSRRCRLGHVISCVQSQLITWDMYTDHQSSPSRATCLSISASFQCSSIPPASTHQCHISVPTSAHQCHISVPI